jgi:hypothetical protein
MPEFKYNEENAPCHRDAVITYETLGDDEILLQKEPLESSGIKEVHSFVKQGRGLLWHNRTLIAQRPPTRNLGALMSTTRIFGFPNGLACTVVNTEHEDAEGQEGDTAGRIRKPPPERKRNHDQ